MSNLGAQELQQLRAKEAEEERLAQLAAEQRSLALIAAREAEEEKACQKKITEIEEQKEYYAAILSRAREANQYLKAETRRIEKFVSELNIFDPGFLDDYPQLLEYIEEVMDNGRVGGLAPSFANAQPVRVAEASSPKIENKPTSRKNTIPLSIQQNPSVQLKYNHQRASRLREQRRLARQENGRNT